MTWRWKDHSFMHVEVCRWMNNNGYQMFCCIRRCSRLCTFMNVCVCVCMRRWGWEVTSVAVLFLHSLIFYHGKDVWLFLHARTHARFALSHKHPLRAHLLHPAPTATQWQTCVHGLESSTSSEKRVRRGWMAYKRGEECSQKFFFFFLRP